MEYQKVYFKELIQQYLFHWRLLLAVLVLCLSAAFIYLSLSNPVYQSKAIIQVKDEKKTSQEQSALQSLDQFQQPSVAEAEIELLKSRKLLNKVIQNLGLTLSYEKKAGWLKKQALYDDVPFHLVFTQKPAEGSVEPLAIMVKDDGHFLVKEGDSTRAYAFNETVENSWGIWKLIPTAELPDYMGQEIKVKYSSAEKVADGLEKGLEAYLLNKVAPTIGLSYNDEIPARGRAILDELLAVYLDDAVWRRNRMAQNTQEMIDRRLAILTGELSEADKNIEGFRSSRGITDLSAQSQVYLENVQVNDNRLNEVNVSLNVVRDIELYLNSEQNSRGVVPAALGINDPGLSQLIEKLNQLELQREKLLATTTEHNPMLEPVNKQLAATRTVIRQNLGGIRSTLTETKRELQGFNKRYESSIRNVPVQERQFLDIKRQQSIKENLYVYLLQKKEEAALSYTPSENDNRIVDAAYSLSTPVSPKKPMVLAISVLASFGLFLTTVFVGNNLNGRLQSKAEAQQLLGVQPVASLSQLNEGAEWPVQSAGGGRGAEQFRYLLAGLPKFGYHGEVFLVTSPQSGDGKAFVSSNLAVSLARNGRQVVLIDADLRKGQLADLEQVPNLEVVKAGDFATGSSVDLNQLEQLLNRLRDAKKTIILNSAAYGDVADAFLFAPLADHTLVIVRQGHTNKNQLTQLAQHIHTKRFPNPLVVYNGAKPNGRDTNAYKDSYL